MLDVLIAASLTMQMAALTPRDTYLRYVVGEYGEEATCTDAAGRWSLTETQVVAGDAWCDIHEIREIDSRTTVTTRNCTARGTALPNRSYAFDFLSADVLEVRFDDHNLMLRRCPVR